MLKARVVEEHKNFETDKNPNLVRLKKKITMLHKVTVILYNKLPDLDLEKNFMKAYQIVDKVIMLEDETFPPPVDDDMTRTPVKLKVKKAKAASSG